MTTTVRCLRPEHDAIEFHHVGVVDEAELAQAFGEMIEIARSLGLWRVVSDCTELTDAPRLLEMLPFVEALESYGVKDRFRQALVRPRDPQAQWKVDFWHGSMTDHGLRVLAFDDRNEALGWLRSSDPRPSS